MASELTAELTAPLQAIQQRVLSCPPALPDTPAKLHAELRSALLAACNTEQLTTPPDQIFKLLKQPTRTKSGHYVIAGGAKNFHCDPALPHFTRDDGAWFDFAITVAQDGPRASRSLSLVGFNFEIRFQDSAAPAFIRFDLNEPEHDNDDRGLRSHAHPGDDDLQVPSPLMSPSEVLALLLYGLRRPDKARRKGRA